MNRVNRDEGMAAWRSFLTAHARVTELLEAELQTEKQISLGWYDVLVQLQETPGNRLRMTELAAKVLLSKSGLTRLVDRMCEAGLVERSFDETDRRGRWVTLNEAGRARLRGAAPVHLRGIAEHFTSLLEDDEATVIASALNRIAGLAESKRGTRTD